MQTLCSPTLRHMNLALLSAVVALLYIITAKIGFLLALPPGNVTAFWPPSGIALAAILLFGWRAILGIWIGSCAVNIATIDSPLVAQIATTIALGSSIQALFCATLLRHFAQTLRDGRYTEIRESAGFFIITALSCSIAPGFGVASLYFGKMIESSQLFTLSWTWWIGDLAGMLVITPLILKLTQYLPRASANKSWLLPNCSTLLGATLIGFFFCWNDQMEKFRKNLDNEAGLMHVAIQQEVLNSLNGLDNLTTIFYRNAAINRNEFLRAAQPILDKNPILTTITWAPVVKKSELSEHLEQARQEGLEDYTLYGMDINGKRTDINKDREVFYPVFFVAPESSSKKIQGFDNISDINRLSSLNLARDNAKIAATGVTYPLEKPEENHYILLFKAVYLNSTAELKNPVPKRSIKKFRRENLRGILAARIDINRLIPLSQKISNPENISVQLWDITIPEKPNLMLESQANKNIHIGNKTPYSSNTFSVANRRWKIDIYPDQQRLEKLDRTIPWLILITGIIVVFIIIAYNGLTKKNAPKIA